MRHAMMSLHTAFCRPSAPSRPLKGIKTVAASSEKRFGPTTCVADSVPALPPRSAAIIMFFFQRAERRCSAPLETDPSATSALRYPDTAQLRVRWCRGKNLRSSQDVSAGSFGNRVIAASGEEFRIQSASTAEILQFDHIRLGGSWRPKDPGWRSMTAIRIHLNEARHRALFGALRRRCCFSAAGVAFAERAPIGLAWGRGRHRRRCRSSL